MKWTMTGLAMLAAAATLTTSASAQMGGAMAHDSMAKNAKTKTYIGCVEAGSDAGTFMLTHLSAPMARSSMAKDSMGKESMGKDSMAKSAMAPESLKLAGTAVDFSKHVGHKVSVTGTAGTMGDFTVKSLKMIAASCM